MKNTPLPTACSAATPPVVGPSGSQSSQNRQTRQEPQTKQDGRNNAGQTPPPSRTLTKNKAGGLRGFIKERRNRVKGFGFLLFYCHMLMLFAFLGKLYLPDLTDMAKAAGAVQAWKLESVQGAANITQNALGGLNAIKDDFEEVKNALRIPEEIKDLRKSAGELSETARNSRAAAWINSNWINSKLSGEENPDEAKTPPPDDLPDTVGAIGANGAASPVDTASPTSRTSSSGSQTPPAKTAAASSPARLPDLAALSGLPLSAKISSALVPIMFIITTLSLLLPPLFRVGVGLGLGHALLSGWLIAKAALSLNGAPELFILCLSDKMQNFADGGHAFWLGGLAALIALLAVTARMGRNRAVNAG